MLTRARRAILRCVYRAFTHSVLISSKKSDTCTLPPAGFMVGEPPPRHHIGEIDMTVGMTRNPMRHLGTTITALSAADAWSFVRPSNRYVMRIVSGCLSHQTQSGLYPRKSD